MTIRRRSRDTLARLQEPGPYRAPWRKRPVSTCSRRCRKPSPCINRAGCARPKSFTRACSKRRPIISTRMHLCGLAKAQAGQMGEAYRLMAGALKLNPQAGDAWMNLANVLHALKRDAEALDCLDKALALRPGDTNALDNRGNALLALGRAQEALACFDAVLMRDPRPRRRAHRPRQPRWQASAVLIRRSPLSMPRSPLMPGHPGALYNRGNALFDARPLRRGDCRLRPRARRRARPCRKPGTTAAARCRRSTAMPTRSRASTRRSRSRRITPTRIPTARSACSRSAIFNAALPNTNGAGSAPACATRGAAIGKPLWLGEYPLAAQDHPAHAEQGLGDTIQFARYVPLLARAGANVVLEVPPELKAAVGESRRRRVAVIARGDPLPAYDVHCPLGSLPLALKTEPATIPADIPYLRADERAHRQMASAPRRAARQARRARLGWQCRPRQRPQPLDRAQAARAAARARGRVVSEHPARITWR